MKDKFVKINNHTSTWGSPNAGVPQGTLLGPTAFIWHINCLQTMCPSVKFVDDTTFWEHCDRKGVNTKLQLATNQVLEWARANDMEINKDKTKLMEIYFEKKT